MSDLDSEEEQILAGARRAWTPSTADAERVLSGTNIALGLASAKAATTFSPLMAATAKWLTGALVVASAAVGGYVLGFRDGREAAMTAAAPIATSPPEPSRLAPPITPPPTPTADLATNLAPRETLPTPLPPHAPRPLAGSNLSEQPSIQVELRALRRVDRALRDDHSALALRILERLDRDVPHGQLLEERAAGSALARCASSRNGSVSSDFTRRYPASVYGERVQAACDEPAADGFENDRQAP